MSERAIKYQYKSRKWWKKMAEIQRGFQHIVAIDFETTGLQTDMDDIIQVGIIKVNAKTHSIIELQQLFKPSTEISAAAAAVHCITTDLVADKEPTHKALEFVLQHCGRHSLVIGYNIHGFDFQILWENIIKYKKEDLFDEINMSHSLDLYLLFRKHKPTKALGRPSNLKECLRTFCGDIHFPNHNALEDAKACIKMLPAMALFYNIPKGRKFIKKFCKSTDHYYIMSDTDIISQAREVMEKYV